MDTRNSEDTMYQLIEFFGHVYSSATQKEAGLIFKAVPDKNRKHVSYQILTNPVSDVRGSAV